MGALMRAHDWSASSLGAPSQWPQSLRTAVRLMLNAGHPICLWWGAEGICLHNDAYGQSVGPERHPASLGRPAREVWDEIWPIIGPQISQVMEGHGGTWHENALIPITRHGRREDVYWTYSFSPIDDDAAPGGVGGVLVICTETTRAVLADQQRAADAERNRQLYDQAPSFVCILRGPEHIFEFVNNAHKDLFNSGEWIGKPVREAFPDIAGQGYFERLDKVYRTGERYVAKGATARYRRTPEGPEEERRLDFIYAPITDDSGAVTGIFCEGYDVTDMHRAEQAASDSEERFREIANAAPVLIWISDKTKAGIWFNKPWLDFTGRTLEQEIGFGWIESKHPDDAARCVEVYSRAFDTQERFQIDYRLRRHDNVWRIINTIGVPRYSNDGTFLGFIGSCVDVTDQRNAEQALRESEEQLRFATDAAEIGFWDVDFVTDTMIWPPRVRAMFGITSSGPVSMADFHAGLHPDDRDHTAKAFAAAADPARRAIYDVEYRTIGQEDGIIRWVAAKGRGHFSSTGECLRVIGTAVDITDRKRSEQQLRDLNDTLERRVAEALAGRRILADIVETTDVLIQVIDTKYRWMAVNRAASDVFESLFGARPKAGDNLLTLLGARGIDDSALKENWSRALAGEAFTRIARFPDPKGGYRSFEMKFNALHDREGKILGAYQFGYDVTAKLRDQARLAEAEEHLRQAQKIEAIGQLTGGVAHDFNNLLMVISGGLSILDRQTDPARRERILDGMRQATVRGASLSRQLLAFSRRRPLNPQPVDLAVHVEGMRELLDRTLHGDVHVSTSFCKDLWPAKADTAELELALLNLCVNARDAMPEGGTITIRADNLPGVDRPDLRGDFIRLSVIDTGTGMPKDVLVRAFEPFYTTKEIGKGSGLGLAQVYGFAQQSGGTVNLESEPGEGTTVTLLLPRSCLAPEQPVRSKTEIIPPVQQADGAAILLVEDDNEVATLVTEMLTQLGYQVLRVASAEGALGALANDRTIDLVFSDIMMPGRMNGIELAREIRRRRPDLPVLLTSGNAESMKMDVSKDRLDILGKPYELHHLAAALERTLAGQSLPLN